MESLNEKGIEEKHENCNLNFNPILSFTKLIKCTAANLDIMEKRTSKSSGVTIVNIYKIFAK